MTRIHKLAGKKAVRGESSGGSASRGRTKSLSATARSGQRKSPKQQASAPGSKRKSFALQGMKIADFYRPLKKPVTLRLDADVLAWFKKDGSRYQTRINRALRQIMEGEMRRAG